MVETIGKRLCQARLSKGLTIDEAAHSTKMRPDKIVALENDDYSRFGNNAYAKGFLQLYGRFLGVDVSEHLSELEVPRYVSVDDYQYLNNVPEPPKHEIRPQRRAAPPSIFPLLVFTALAGLAIFGFIIYVQWERIAPNSSGTTSKAHVPSASRETAPATETEKAGGEGETAPPSEKAQPAQLPRTPERPHAAGQTAVASNSEIDGVEVRRAEPASPAAAQTSSNTPATAATTSKSPAVAEPVTPAGGMNEVVVEPLKKTWVIIRKGSPDSPPVFEDYLYPGPPLKLRGSKFFVEVRDQTAVQIRKNGAPIAYQAPGISIQ